MKSDYIERGIDRELLAWKNEKGRKPLLIRGARQVGKSRTIRNFGESNDISLINKGAIAEQFVGLELLKSSSCYWQSELYFWSREKSQSNAEVDYVVQKGEKIIPIEVKSGSSGKMQSMFMFLNEKKCEYGVRTTLENFASYDKIKVYPLYAIGNLLKNQNDKI